MGDTGKRRGWERGWSCRREGERLSKGAPWLLPGLRLLLPQSWLLLHSRSPPSAAPVTVTHGAGINHSRSAHAPTRVSLCVCPMCLPLLLWLLGESFPACPRLSCSERAGKGMELSCRTSRDIHGLGCSISHWCSQPWDTAPIPAFLAAEPSIASRSLQRRKLRRPQPPLLGCCFSIPVVIPSFPSLVQEGLALRCQ